MVGDNIWVHFQIWKYALWDTAFRVSESFAYILQRKSESQSEVKQDNDGYTCQGSSDMISGQWSHDRLPKMVKKNESCSPVL
jgi:hypothetical protein